MNTELLISTIKNPSICLHNIENAKSDSMWDWHIHDEYEMYLTIDGNKTFFVNDKEYNLSSGDIIFINERVPHKTKTFKGCIGYLIQFKSINMTDNVYRYLTYFINNSSLDVSIFKASTAINTELNNCLSNIIKENSERAKSYEDYIKAEVYKIFAILYRYNIIKNPEYFFAANEINKIMPALQYIDKHYSEKISLENISALLNFDKSHFCRIFKKSVNASLVDYINFVRTSKAEKLLRETEKTISDIAEATGFFSAAYFTKMFKRYKSCTPSKYRKYKIIS